MCVHPRVANTVIAKGLTGSKYKVVDVQVAAGCSGGTYTFLSTSGTGGSVALFKDGVQQKTLSYVWTTTVGAGLEYKFDFGTSYFSITVTRAESGTMNLYGMPEFIFDGKATLVVVLGMRLIANSNC